MTATLVRKTWMALTGLFLCLFLAVHLAGNLQLLLPEPVARGRFNAYAEFLAGLPVIAVAAWVTYAAVVGHAVLAAVLWVTNRRADGAAYASRSTSATAVGPARFMGLLGLVVLAFLGLHLADFWWPFKFGDVARDEAGRRDLYGLVAAEFGRGWKVALYVVGVLALGLHLLHGVYSGLRTLGLSHPGYARWGRRLGIVFTVGVTVGFAALPLYLHLAR